MIIKSIITLTLFEFLFNSVGLDRILAQNLKKWELAISTNYGKDQFNIDYKKLTPYPGLITKYRSRYSIGAGFTGERYLTPSFSIMGAANYYTTILGSENMLCGCSSTELYFATKEKYHWVGLATGVRWYLNPEASAKVFLEGLIKTDYFLADTRILNDDSEKLVHWNAYGYQRVVPGFSGGFGVKWKRLAVLAEYDRNIPSTFSRNIGNHYDIMYDLKSNILKQRLAVKASFTLLKFH